MFYNYRVPLVKYTYSFYHQHLVGIEPINIYVQREIESNIKRRIALESIPNKIANIQESLSAL